MSDKLNLKTDQELNTVESFKFEPIKGYPMLNWKGKRPFTSTQFYPAQLKENFGEEINGWMNQIFWGDNLQVMSHLLKKYRGQIDLIYIDPPFDSKADYKKKIQLKGKELYNNSTSFEEKQYTDIWSNDEYLQFMFERIILMRELLSDNGSFFLHCDYHKNHLLRCIIEEIFGKDNIVNEIIWCYTRPAVPNQKNFSRVHDTIYWYRKGDKIKFNADDVRIPYSQGSLDRAGYAGTASKMTGGSGVELKEGGKIAEDWWDIPVLKGNSREYLAYPTQKPEKLIERIIKATTKAGDIIFDCFMGSGTTQAVAMKLGRRFIGADINLGAIQTTSKRLFNLSIELSTKKDKLNLKVEGEAEDILYTGFSVFNVNNYDVFRNPSEAKDLLLKALEIQPMPGSSIYDGEKDGRMVKIMPINRIATRSDLNNLINNFDYRTFEKRQSQSPGKPVESLLLICMGHEPDLAASLQSQLQYKLDIEVVDILRDKSNLEFKRDAEAEIEIEGGKLIIRDFYPMNLLQKLSIMKEHVDNWKELTESVMVDFNYDGSVFEPTIVDIPEGDNLVIGIYSIPATSGTIRLKITDLLSESFEKTIN